MGFVYIVGLALVKYSKDSTRPAEFVKRNLILSAVIAAVVVIAFYLIGGLVFNLTGLAILIIVSFIYINIFVPIAFPKEAVETEKKEQISRQLLLSGAFIMFYGILYLVFLVF